MRKCVSHFDRQCARFRAILEESIQQQANVLQGPRLTLAVKNILKELMKSKSKWHYSPRSRNDLDSKILKRQSFVWDTNFVFRLSMIRIKYTWCRLLPRPATTRTIFWLSLGSSNSSRTSLVTCFLLVLWDILVRLTAFFEGLSWWCYVTGKKRLSTCKARNYQTPGMGKSKLSKMLLFGKYFMPTRILLQNIRIFCQKCQFGTTSKSEILVTVFVSVIKDPYEIKWNIHVNM